MRKPLTPKEMVELYYPKFWSRERVEALVKAGKLTQAEADRVMGGEGHDGT